MTGSLFAGVLGDAWALWRRERDLLLRVAAPWLFLPAFALALLVAPPPPLPAGDDGAGTAAAQAWAEAVLAWAGSDGGWYLLAHLAGLVGAGTLYALLLGSGATVGAALRQGARALPRLVLATLATAPVIVLGLSLWIAPGLYAIGRLMLVAPALVAERRGVLAAIGASIRRTRGHGLQLATAAAIPLVGGWLAAQPFVSLDRLMRAGGQANPVALAIVDAGTAAAAFAAGVAQALIAVAAYRRLA